MITKEEKRRVGKRSRILGKAFEKKVREDLEDRGWMTLKFDRQVDLENNKLGIAKGQFNPFYRRIVGEGSGFPDFICFKPLMEKTTIMLVESKMAGKLDKIEKQKCDWIKNNLKIPIFIASKGEKEIIYTEYSPNLQDSNNPSS